LAVIFANANHRTTVTPCDKIHTCRSSVLLSARELRAASHACNLPIVVSTRRGKFCRFFQIFRQREDSSIEGFISLEFFYSLLDIDYEESSMIDDNDRAISANGSNDLAIAIFVLVLCTSDQYHDSNTGYLQVNFVSSRFE